MDGTHALREPKLAYKPAFSSKTGPCKTCGGHIFTEHPGMGLTDVNAAVIPDFPYHAGVHFHYQETKLRIKDGLPKMKGVAKEIGSSGVSAAE